MNITKFIAAAVTAVAVSVVACGTSDTAGTTRPSGGDSGGTPLLPGVTLADWVGYADYVIYATAVSDTEMPLTPAEVQRGEGLQGRHVQLRVDRVLWKNPGPATAELPGQITFPGAGWIWHDNKRGAIEIPGTPRIVVGHSYILPIVPMQNTTWNVLSSIAMIPADNGVVGRGEGANRETDEASQAEALTAGARLDDLEALLKTAKPDPIVAKYANLDPLARFQAVSAELYPQNQPGP